MVNLLQETLNIMEEHDKTPKDVIWIGSKDGKYVCTWDEFAKLADRKYDNDYGAPEVAMDLVIVFKDGSWLERYEYDGSEWWEFNQTPQKKKQTKKIKHLFANEVGRIGWVFLKDLHYPKYLH